MYAMRRKNVRRVHTAGDVFAPGHSSGLYGVSLTLLIFVYRIYPDDISPAMHPTGAIPGSLLINMADTTVAPIPISVLDSVGSPGVSGLSSFAFPVYAASAPETMAAALYVRMS